MITMEESLERLTACLTDLHAPVLEYLQPGLTREEIEEQEQKANLRLPDELRMLYQWRNGTDYTPNLAHAALVSGMHHMMPLQEAIDDNLRLMRHQVRNHPAWLPVLGNDCGDYFLVPCSSPQIEAEYAASPGRTWTTTPWGEPRVDHFSIEATAAVKSLQSLAVAMREASGTPVIEYVHDDPDQPWPVFAYLSLPTMLLTSEQCFRHGAYVITDDGIDVNYDLERDISAELNPGLERWSRGW